ncbi:hypothetical protein, partial [Actinokineospora alba]|uniref:hypothetical protein n=1 Tax=Actinokineospora alba TaxID=504798 RepID=UPI001E5B1C71
VELRFTRASLRHLHTEQGLALSVHETPALTRLEYLGKRDLREVFWSKLDHLPVAAVQRLEWVVEGFFAGDPSSSGDRMRIVVLEDPGKLADSELVRYVRGEVGRVVERLLAEGGIDPEQVATKAEAFLAGFVDVRPFPKPKGRVRAMFVTVAPSGEGLESGGAGRKRSAVGAVGEGARKRRRRDEVAADVTVPGEFEFSQERSLRLAGVVDGVLVSDGAVFEELLSERVAQTETAIEWARGDERIRVLGEQDPVLGLTLADEQEAVHARFEEWLREQHALQMAVFEQDVAALVPDWNVVPGLFDVLTEQVMANADAFDRVLREQSDAAAALFRRSRLVQVDVDLEGALDAAAPEALIERVKIGRAQESGEAFERVRGRQTELTRAVVELQSARVWLDAVERTDPDRAGRLRSAAARAEQEFEVALSALAAPYEEALGSRVSELAEAEDLSSFADALVAQLEVNRATAERVMSERQTLRMAEFWRHQRSLGDGAVDDLIPDIDGPGLGLDEFDELLAGFESFLADYAASELPAGDVPVQLGESSAAGAEAGAASELGQNTSAGTQ